METISNSYYASDRTRDKCSDDAVVIWLDDQSENDSRGLITQLKNMVSTVNIFNEINACADFITDIENQRIFLIISASFSKQIVPLLHDVPHLNSIYVLCSMHTRKKVDIRCLSKYRKFKQYFIETNSLCNYLQRDINQKNDFDQTLISFHDGKAKIGSVEEENLNELNAMFMYSWLLKDILINMQHGKKSVKEYADFCRVKYAGDRFSLNFIEEFERDYDKCTPVSWYTRESFIYHMLNEALREHKTETLLHMGFFIRDLHRQLEQIQATTEFKMLTVYRGQSVSNKEFAHIKQISGGLISFNNFLSTSPDKELAQGFAEGQIGKPEHTAILFTIAISPEVKSIPFASLNGFHFMEDENEVLFSMHTVCRIESIQQQIRQPDVWDIHLRLTSPEIDENLARLTRHMQEEIEGGTSLHKLGQLTTRMGEYDRAQEIYELLILSTPTNDKRGLAFLHHQLGVVYNSQGSLDDALSHYRKSLEFELSYLPSNHPALSPTYSNIGMLFEDKHELNQALEYYEKALDIDLKAPVFDQQSVSIDYNNIAGILLRLGRCDEAQTKYNQCLELQLKTLPPTHPQIGGLYSNMGVLCLEKHDWLQALDYFNQGLTIQRKSVPNNHPSLAITLYNIALAYEGLHQYTDAVKYAEQAKDIVASTFSPTHPECLSYCMYLDKLRSKL